MPRRNPASKLTITIDPALRAQVFAAAAAENVSVSAWIARAAGRALHIRDGLAAVAEWEAEHGAISKEQKRRARRRVLRELRAKPSRPKRNYSK